MSNNNRAKESSLIRFFRQIIKTPLDNNIVRTSSRTLCKIDQPISFKPTACQSCGTGVSIPLEIEQLDSNH